MMMSKIAFRNILRQKRRSLLTALMMAGGTALFSLSVGISDGSYSNLIDMFTRDHTGHVQIHRKGYLDKPSLYNTFDHPDSLGLKIESLPYVEAWTPRVYSPALAFVGKKTTGVRMIGVHSRREGGTTRLRRKVRKGRFLSDVPAREMMIGGGVAEILKADIGDEIALIAQGADGSIATDLFEVVGMVSDGGDSYERMNCYVPIATAQEFLVLGGRVHELAVALTDQSRSERVAKMIQAGLDDGSLDIAPWQVVEASFYRAMQADIEGMWLSLMIIMIIVAIGVLNTVLMTLLERTREFGVLRALGTRPRDVFRLIVLETTYLSVLSILLGGALGLLGNYVFSKHGIALPTPVEYGGVLFDKMMGKISFRAFWLPAVVTLGTAVVVSVLPALRAAKVAPVKAMRNY